MAAKLSRPVAVETTEAPSPVEPAQKEASSAFQEIEPELATLDASDLIRPIIDIPRAVSMALGALPAIRSYKDDIARMLPQFAIDTIDKLETYALAAFYAHLLAMPPSSIATTVQTLLKEATPLRERMLAGADTLALFGVFDPARVTEIHAGSGHLDVAGDLVALAAMFKEKWDDVKDKTPLTRAEVDRSEQLGTELVIALGARIQPGGEPPVTVQAADRRVRAFTLFVNAYDTCRRAISFVRWDEDDVDDIAPSLFTRPRGRRPKPEPTPNPPTGAGDAPVVTPPSPVTPPAPPAPPAPVNG